MSKTSKPLFSHLLVLAVFAGAVFLGSLTLIWSSNLHLSPDESANVFFTRQFAESGQLAAAEPLNLVLSDILHPRSLLSLNGRLLPGSFLGLPVLYGALAAVSTPNILPYLTAFFAFLAVLAWFGIVRRIFSPQIALISSLLLACHPAWWYYSARPFMHNVLFVSLLIFGLYLFTARPLKTWFRKNPSALISLVDPFLAGLCLGLAVFVRSSEVIWLALGLAVAYLFYRRTVSWRVWVTAALGVVLALLPMLYFNHQTYGHVFLTGYTVEPVGPEIVESVPPEPPAFANAALNQTWEQLQAALSPVLPFGLHPRNILRHLSSYGLSLFWWLTIFAVLGLLSFLTRAERKQLPAKTYLWTGLAISAWLILLYGSWAFHDNPDPNSITLANSYVRYWLPIYLFSTPFSALGILWLVQKLKGVRVQNLAVILFLAMSFALSLHQVFYTPGDGLLAAAATLERSAQIKQQVLALTEPDSIVIVDYADKIFFPERRVRVPLRSEVTYQFMPAMLKQAPLYYYGVTLPDKDLEYLNEVKLKDGLQIELVKTFDAESLYRISR
ncbi:hypothetical protein KJ611_01970 [Patescibacteria group bacterium]|nr:hypothetical protein [Patescibacteria group bacterium]MBU1705448.1 hypothetical protein [Patescibacteria group bacterium]